MDSGSVMGADGGTIPKRCELVKNKKKKEKLDRSVANATRWRLCRLSQEPLKRPIVACRFGKYVICLFCLIKLFRCFVCVSSEFITTVISPAFFFPYEESVFSPLVFLPLSSAA